MSRQIAAWGGARPEGAWGALEIIEIFAVPIRTLAAYQGLPHLFSISVSVSLFLFLLALRSSLRQDLAHITDSQDVVVHCLLRCWILEQQRGAYRSLCGSVSDVLFAE